jgi:hypothetical protein
MTTVFRSACVITSISTVQNNLLLRMLSLPADRREKSELLCAINNC